MRDSSYYVDQAFKTWFFEGEHSANQTFVISEKGQRDYWMEKAFKAGARAASQDVLNTLADYACAVEGLDPELVTPAEIFDRARENLFIYLTKVLNDNG